MPQPHTSGKRGRPPGTGKNDTDRLQKIAALMAADPELKPTTAIKQIGETDPSAIRRLRDKYNEQQALSLSNSSGAISAPRLTAPSAATVQAVTPPMFRPGAVHQAPAFVVAAVTDRAPAATVEPLAAEVAPCRTTETAINFEPLFKPAPVQDPFAVLGKWFGNGIETAAVLFEQQMMFAQTMLKAAPVKAMWCQQIVATEYLLMLSGPGQRIAAPTLTTNR
jgi:hypothetical protein